MIHHGFKAWTGLTAACLALALAGCQSNMQSAAVGDPPAPAPVPVPAPAPAGPFELAPLPYDRAALAPTISAETLDYHWGKHARAYTDNLNKMTAGKPEAKMSVEEIVKTSSGPLFNNAAQAWNHAFYWQSLKPGGGGEPTGELLAAIVRDFGSFAKFREEFAAAAGSLFGSGWTWLVLEGGKLKITQTSNADLPMKHGQEALFVVDVWEHAYYIDYRNARPKYVKELLDKLVNWDFAAANYARAMQPR